MLFEPISIRGRTIRNRIAFGSHSTEFLKDCLVTDRLIAYYAARARGGVGLIISEAIRVHATTMASEHQAKGYDPAIVPGFARLADAVHAHGAVMFAQILHSGRSMSSQDSRLPLWAPSGTAMPGATEVPHAMTTAEIREVIDAHALTAKHIMAAGLDGIEINAAHGYLIHHFMSPLTNQRTDSYGGSLENRVRLAQEVIEAVRQAVGSDVPVGMRIIGEERSPGGLDLRAMQEIAVIVGKHLDYLSVSVARENIVPDMNYPPGLYVHLASAIRLALRQSGLAIPVLTVGRILEPEQAEQILAAEHADMIVMVRALIADPEWATKARSGRADQICPCIGCNQGCLANVLNHRPLTCLVNPAAGHEAEWDIDSEPRVRNPKRVLVVGAGPAGLEAARVAASRGHAVTVWESRDRIGGQTVAASQPRNRAYFGKFVEWLGEELKRLGVDVQLNSEATADKIVGAGYDTVVVATGAMPALRSFVGDSTVPILDVVDALANLSGLGQRVVLLDEDRHHKAGAVAEELAATGRDVIVVVPNGEPGDELTRWDFLGLRARLGQQQVKVLPFTDVTRIAGNVIWVREQFTGQETALNEIDVLIVAEPYRAKNELLNALFDIQPLAAGDCVAPRRALEAMQEGHQIGRMV